LLTPVFAQPATVADFFRGNFSGGMAYDSAPQSGKIRQPACDPTGRFFMD
jgi:hypothetical protein